MCFLYFLYNREVIYIFIYEIMKKILAIIALLSLSFSGVFAAIKTESEAAKSLAKEGIISDQWDEITAYRLGETITRKEVMKVVMKLSWLSVIDECRGVYSDVTADWGCKYIETAFDEWFVAANDTFRPDDNITKTEAMKLVLRSKWIQKIQDTSAWQEDYMLTAFEHGIIDEKYTDYNTQATRGWIFQIATATLDQEEEIIEKGGIVSDEWAIPEGDDQLDDFFEDLVN